MSVCIYHTHTQTHIEKVHFKMRKLHLFYLFMDIIGQMLIA